MQEMELNKGTMKKSIAAFDAILTSHISCFTSVYMKYAIATFAVVLISHTSHLTSAFAQDVHFSQFNETPQLINPGAAGATNGMIRGIVNYKNQWSAMGNAFNTVAASVDMPLFDSKQNKAHMGAGLNFFSDKAGESKFGLTQVNLCLAGIVPVADNSTFSLGLSLGFAQHKANLNVLTWGSQYDGSGFNTAINSNETTPSNSFMYADIGAGMQYEYSNGKSTIDRSEQKRFAVGVSYFHLNRPEQKYFSVSDKLLGKLVVNVRGHFDKEGTSYSFIPSAVYYKQGPSSECMIGGALRYRIKKASRVTGFINESAIAFGLHYRVKDAIVPQVYFELSSLAIGVSYDITVSTYNQAAKYKGGPEISLKYGLKKPKNMGMSQRSAIKL